MVKGFRTKKYRGRPGIALPVRRVGRAGETSCPLLRPARKAALHPLGLPDEISPIRAARGAARSSRVTQGVDVAVEQAGDQQLLMGAEAVGDLVAAGEAAGESPAVCEEGFHVR